MRIMVDEKVPEDKQDTKDEDGTVALPRDANGVVMHPGDPIVIRCIGWNSYKKVISLDLREDGWVVRVGSGTRMDDGTLRPDHVEVLLGNTQDK